MPPLLNSGESAKWSPGSKALEFQPFLPVVPNRLPRRIHREGHDLAFLLLQPRNQKRCGRTIWAFSPVKCTARVYPALQT